MADVAYRNAKLVDAYVGQATALLDARDALKALRERLETLGADAVLTPDAFASPNQHVEAADFPPYLAAVDALEAVLIDPATREPTDHLKALMKFRRS